MSKTAELHYNGKIFKLPIITGSENENALDDFVNKKRFDKH